MAAMLRGMSEQAASDIQYIDTHSALTHFCDAIKNSEWLAIDTEFVREKTYYPLLCLIQVSNGEQLACIDPLAIDDLQPLFDVLYDESITKVFHAASQDLEIFAHLRDELPAPLFDTQIAAALLGHGNQVSYAALMQSLCDVELDKSHSRTDWSKRPLSSAQINYAADDVRYLGKAYLLLCDELEKTGRAEWLKEDFRQLADARRYRVDPAQAWQSLKGLDKLPGQNLVFAQALASWREQHAQKIDKPKRWVLRDEILLALADGPAANNDDLDACGLTEKTRNRFGGEWLQILKNAANVPESLRPVRKRFEKPTPAQRKLAKDMMNALQGIGKQHNIDPGLLGTRKIVERLINGDRDLPVLQGWRNEIAGQRLLTIIGESTE